MADSLASAWVEVLPDFKEFKRSANGEMTSILGDAGDRGGKKAGAGVGAGIIGGISGVVALGALSIAGDIGRLIGDAIGSSINFALDGIDLASDLAESTNAIKVSFGEAADGIASLGADAATRLALTQTEFNGIATQFSAFAKTIVGDGGDVVGLIDDLTGRGADFASVYNIEVADALALFQSGLAGETEPLRKYGLDLSDAAVKAYAAANGIGTLGTELTEAQKVQARYGLLMEKTTAVAGDFANTSGGLANQQRILAASLAEAQTKLGTALLPSLTALTALANDELIPALNGVVAEIGPELASALSESMPAFKDLLLAVVPLIPELVKLGVSALPPILQILTLLSPLLIDQAANTSYVLEATQALFAFLTGNSTLEEFGQRVIGLGGSFADFNETLVTVLNSAGTNFANFIATVIGSVGSAVSTITALPGQVLTAFSSVGTTLLQSGKDLIDGFIKGVQAKAAALADAALKVVKDAVNGVKEFLQIKSPSRLFEQFGVYTAEGYIQGIDSEAGNVASSLQSMVALPTVSAYGVAANVNGTSSSAAAGAPAFANYGTIQVTDEAALVDEVEKRKRRAYALSGLNGVKVA